MRRAAVAGLVLLFLTGCAGPAIRRGVAFYQEGRYDSALAEFNVAIGRLGSDADFAMAYNDRGIVRQRLGDTKGAAEDYTQAMAYVPGDASLWFHRGNAYTVSGLYVNAIADYTRAVELRPTYTEALFNRGTARLRIGDVEGARSDWRHAIEIEPDPFKRQAMERSSGLGRGIGAPPAPSDAPGAVVPAPPSASVDAPAPPAAAALDARALATRAIAKDLDGDHVGALQDLRAALAMETDPARRANLEGLLRRLDSP
ncbi:MAG: tetratricopeptide repeat protein [Candidatus Rokubacteria bacterium]|nr:tetratricopeptide repeat protein [Candidatus Rokubacteria bacterium]